MPCIKVKKGYKIRRSAGGLYPKIYTSLAACQERAEQMEKFKKAKKAGWKPAGKKAAKAAIRKEL